MKREHSAGCLDRLMIKIKTARRVLTLNLELSVFDKIIQDDSAKDAKIFFTGWR